MAIDSGASREVLLGRCVEAAREAAELLLRMRRVGDVDVTATKSSPTDIVTNADAAAEDLLRARLFDPERGDSWLGEESGSVMGESGAEAVRWIVDPLDGTVNYLYDLPGWAVSVAAERDGEIVAGCVLVPSAGETFAATRGGGSMCNGLRLSVSSCDELSQALVATGFSYDREVRERQGLVLAGLLPRVRDIRRSGSAATDLCSLAAGRVDAFYETGLQPWDRAAGVLIAQQAGARVDEATDGSVVAANPRLWPAFAGQLQGRAS